MPQLNQIIALVKGEKGRGETAFTKVYRDAQKTEPYAGISRTYQPKDDDGDRYPSEGTKVQLNAEELLKQLETALTRLFDLTYDLEHGNTLARADVVVDGIRVLEDVPVTYLLFLEKKLVDLQTFAKVLPTLDPSVSWTPDTANGGYRTDAVQTIKTKKVPRNHVKAEATDKHPAQVEIFHEDVLVGYWNTTKFSGAMQATRVAELVARTQKLADAVKVAREAANTIEVAPTHVASKVFEYLFS